MAETRDELVRRAALESCRAVWKAMHPGTFDDDCPAKKRWMREEIEALEPALTVLEEAGVLRW
jgi:hypothetical protein